MKPSPLDVKKKKVIQQIRTLLNDYPEVHPLDHKVLICATYTVLKDLHLNLMELDNPNLKGKDGKKEKTIEQVAHNLERAKRLTHRRGINIQSPISTPLTKNRTKRNKTAIERLPFDIDLNIA
jgi:hypothetical protein